MDARPEHHRPHAWPAGAGDLRAAQKVRLAVGARMQRGERQGVRELERGVRPGERRPRGVGVGLG